MDRRRRAARTVALMSLFSMTDTQENVRVASFDGDGSDLISLIVGIDPVQAGSGDPSPDNVRPISGWTGANIHVSPTTDAADGTTYSITFPSSAGTVYGGTLDVTTGKLTVDRAMVDLGTLTWTYSNNVGYFYATPTNINPSASNSSTPNIVCEIYKTSAPNNVYSGSADNSVTCTAASPSSLWVRDSRYTDAATFKAAMSGVQLVYELASPIVYDLTPTEVSTLLGTNNIWADTGDIKYIEYNI